MKKVAILFITVVSTIAFLACINLNEEGEVSALTESKTKNVETTKPNNNNKEVGLKIKQTEIETTPPKEETEMEYGIHLFKDIEVSILENVLNRNGTNPLTGHGKTFLEKGKEYGISAEFMVAVSVQETGYGKRSSLLSNHNNVGGIRCVQDSETREKFNITGCIKNKYGQFSIYKSIEDSIGHKAYLLSRYYVEKGIVDIKEVGEKYAPNDDPKDINKMNSNWVRGVSSNLEKMGVVINQ